MTVTPKLDSTGMTTLRTADVRENLVDAIHAASDFGPYTQTGPDKVLGQVLDCPAAEIGSTYELIQANWDAWDPDTAEGVQLDNLCRIAGITRNPATYSTVTLTLTGTPSTVVAAGKRARVVGGAIFALDADATIGGGGTVDAAATATVAGALEASAGSVDTIVDAVAGWTGVTNAADAEAGTEIETDSALRLRRRITISRGGSCTDQAARAALDALDDVAAAIVISNRGDTTDAYGIPGHQRMSIVHPSTADPLSIARAIWDHLGGGLQSYGTQEYVVTNAQNYATTVRWSWATAVDVYVDVTVTKTADYPAGGDALVKAEVLAYGATLTVENDVLPIAIIDAIYDAVPGIEHLVIKVGKTAGPTATTPLILDLTEIADFDSARVTVTSS